jgi:hypothetical protein
MLQFHLQCLICVFFVSFCYNFSTMRPNDFHVFSQAKPQILCKPQTSIYFRGGNVRCSGEQTHVTRDS